MPIYNGTSEAQKLRDLNSGTTSATTELCYFGPLTCPVGPLVLHLLAVLSTAGPLRNSDS